MTNNLTKRERTLKELDEVSNFTLEKKVNDLNNHWGVTFKNYGGESITKFPDAVKAGEIVIKDTPNNESLSLPVLKAIWNDDVKKKTSSYVIAVDGVVAKIGALKDGVKSNSFSQYFTGVTGSPSRRSCGGYTFLSAMLKKGCRVEVYHVTMNGMANVEIPTIDGIIKGEMSFASREIEKRNLDVYKLKSGGKAPFLNIKERNATYPKELDALYEVVNQRILKTKKYTD